MRVLSEGDAVFNPIRMVRPENRRDSGFALIIVIWGIGVISVLALAFVAAARERVQSSVNIVRAIQSDALADGAIALALASVARFAQASESTPRYTGEPLYCSMPEGSLAAIAIEDEGGKVDINAATQPLLALLLQGVGLERSRAGTLARNIAIFRSAANRQTQMDDEAYRAAGLLYGPKHALFQTSLELDQVIGFDARLFRLLLPLVTTYAGRPGINPETAPPALFAALSGIEPAVVVSLIEHPWPNQIDRNHQKFPLAFLASGASGVLMVHVDVLSPGGQSSVRERLVDVQSPAVEKYLIKETRRGVPRFLDTLRALGGQGAGALPQC